MNGWWEESVEVVCSALHADVHKGLSVEEAKRRLKESGPNRLPDPPKISLIHLFFRQFASFVIWILIAAVAISMLLGEWIDALVIIAILLLNALLGFVQEVRARQSLNALRRLSVPMAKVMRSGSISTIRSEEIVPGDLVLLEAGDHIPVDGRLIESTHLATQEAALTGESHSIHKTADPVMGAEALGDRTNMGFMGTAVVSGKGKLIATATGINTELGKIATLLKEIKEEKTPLENRLEKLGHRLVFLCLGIVVVVFLLGLFRETPLLDMLLISLSLAVAAVPEGLPAVVTMALSIGVRRMAARNCLVRRLVSVETLGGVSVICSDKTGTLTQNEMEVASLWVDRHLCTLSDGGDVQLALKIGILCSTAIVKEGKIIGDPTEGALLKAGEKVGLPSYDEPLLQEHPFDSKRKMMSMLRSSPQGPILYIKGAPEAVLESCHQFWSEHRAIALTKELREEVLEETRKLASKGYRVIALAMQEIFVGLIAFSDPLRPEVLGALRTCATAGIRTVMITGDHKETATSIAHQLGLLEERCAMTGSELEGLSDAQLKEKIESIAVFARVSPEHKLRIVRALKERGEIVAMSGDGVNDAPALKEANIGLAMGLTGTDVAKEASDMVIADDNFASIVHGIEEGRCIYDNIRKTVIYLLSGNIAEIFVIFIVMLLNFTDANGNLLIPLLPVQLLWLNLITDGFPAVALALDPLSRQAMQKKPKDYSGAILSAKTNCLLGAMNAYMTLLVLLAFFYGLNYSAALAQTMTFTTLVFLELVKVQLIRAEYGLSLRVNPWVWGSILLSTALQLLVVYLPFLQPIFGTTSLNEKDWGALIALSILLWVGGKLFASMINSIYSKKYGTL